MEASIDETGQDVLKTLVLRFRHHRVKLERDESVITSGQTDPW